ncbi:MAG TPA: hypothetical protein VK783_08175 [Bacteroidia bacterium]|jgi:hypothetical protein|nr:hypothetical protein [Bacteroidia bacterium]
MIKKYLLCAVLALSSVILAAQPESAKKDSILKAALSALPDFTPVADTNLAYQFTIKINPGLLFSEQGLSFQYNLQNNFGIVLGAGYNEDFSGNQNFPNTGGHGYTIRAGVLQYLDDAKKYYFCFEGFYRNFGKITAVAEDTEGFTQGIDDLVINPLRQNLGSVSVGDGQKVDVYTAEVHMICFDAVMGYQYRKKHFVLDMFGGLGSREKTIHLHETGYYANPFDGSIGPFIPYATVQSKTIDNTYLDVKLGFTLGYRF